MTGSVRAKGVKLTATQLYGVLLDKLQKYIIEYARLLNIDKVGSIGNNPQLRGGYALVDEFCRRHGSAGIMLTHHHQRPCGNGAKRPRVNCTPDLGKINHRGQVRPLCLAKDLVF